MNDFVYFLSKITDATLIELSIRLKDDKVKSSVDEVTEVEEESLQSSFRCEVAAFRWYSKDFSQKSTTNAG